MNTIDPQSELTTLFVSECAQALGRLERLIMGSERSGELREPQEMFRILHTLKGACAMMELAPLVEAAHSLEDIFALIKADPGAVRGEQLACVTDAVLGFTEYFASALSDIPLPPRRDERLCAQIESLAASLGVDKQPAPALTPRETPGDGKTPAADHGDGKTWAIIMLKKCPLPNIRASVIARSASGLCSALITNPANIDRASQYADAILTNGFEIGFVPAPPATAQEVVKKISSQPYVLSCRLRKKDEPAAAEQLVSVPQSLINSLVAAMGEVASAQGAAEAYAKSPDYNARQMAELLAALRRTVAEANLITSRIGTHDVGSVFMQMQRAIRTMARDLGKEIRVATVGGELQADKSILDILSDSMIHMVRNAADHGIEAPAEREARSKPRAGLITLSAQKKNDHLIVTVSDDGAGIDRQAMLDRAERLGKLIKPREQYTDKEVGELLLASGVSTNASVTQYSGRGVGLDTVVRRVRQAGGRVYVRSAPGRGTTFTLNIPITLLMIDGIAITAMDGSELIVPANALRHIAVSSSAPPAYEYEGSSYHHLLFPGQAEGSDAGEGYTLLLERDFGPYYLRAASVSMMGAYYVKQMPQFIADTMGRGDIFSGCVLRPDGGLCCVLDAAKLISAAEKGGISARQAQGNTF